jgi:hypothetical protein
VSDEPAAQVSGQYFYHLRPRPCDPTARVEARQSALLDSCERLSGVPFPQT